MSRRWELDALRGLMLVLMTLTHLPTRFSYPLGHTFGFVSAAEGFVLLSGFMAGAVYTRRARQGGWQAMRQAYWQRARLIYACHLGLLLALLLVYAPWAAARGQADLTQLTAYFTSHPWAATASAAALLWQPALLDILPMYVIFMLLSPLLVQQGQRHGWGWVLGASVLVWGLAQFDVGARLYDAAAGATGLTLAREETGSFVVLGWQFLWVLGLWLGSAQANGERPVGAFPTWMVHAALGIAVVCLVWRHLVGHDPFGTDMSLNALFDKWHLGPLRVLNLFALLVVVLHFGPALVRGQRPRLAYFETLGRASLSVFCVHLLVVLLALTLFGGNPQRHSIWIDLALLGGCFTVLWCTARWAGRPPSSGARLGPRPAAAALRVSAGAPR
ncbi:OpgC domain-containing protein [Caldimonas brevitalea]|uniref:Acyltransferase n=1 Tax=Caldimonas brevitalea TaxID=413882 RepID=A0A0G3BLN7_9BURK|nr:OpgC domain-containing protein [Caldimonas brevitalea]AKJ30307.1 hypothetical protein AAW51_3616 [Caldimonas brevitalea]